MLDEELLESLSVRNKDIYTNIVDYSVPRRDKPVLAKCSYEELRSGMVNLKGKKIKTAPLSSLYKSRLIADKLKKWIQDGKFTLQEPIWAFPKVESLKLLNV